MKRIVSVSIGSSTRDKSVEAVILGEKYLIERIGTDGDIKKAIEMLKSLDGKVDAFGLGGIDLYLGAGSGKKYLLREAIPIMNAARVTPIVDGSGLKKTLERKIIEFLENGGILKIKDKKVLITSAIDRYKMAETFVKYGANLVIGDLIFALGIPVTLQNLKSLKIIASILMPVISRLPFEMLYPTGEKQKEVHGKRFDRFYLNADIIAGDFHYVKKYMPDRLENKIIVTNTVTEEDVEFLKYRGVEMLVTTTPELDGRSFGTNVMEALLVSASGKRPEDLSEQDYYDMLEKLDFKPRIEYLQRKKA
jgi:hypothetical protein